MTDLISRRALLKIIREWPEHLGVLNNPTCEEYAERYGNLEALSAIAGEVERLPAADAVPVVHAEWISEVVTKRDWKGMLKQYYQPCSCSACHEPAIQKYNYCPNCGARMDGESEEDTDGSQTD